MRGELLRPSQRWLSALVALLVAGTLAGNAAREPKAIRESPLADRQKALHLLNRITFGPRPGDVERLAQRSLAAFIERQLDPSDIPDPKLPERLERLETIHLTSRELVELFPDGRVVRAFVNQELLAPEAVPAGMLPDDAQKPEASKRRRSSAASRSMEGRQRDTRKQRRGRAPNINPIYEPLHRLDDPAVLPTLGRQPARVIRGLNRRHMIVLQMQAAKVVRAVHSERQLQEVMVDFWFNHFNVHLGNDAVTRFGPSYERDVIRPYALGRFRDLLGAVAHSPAMLAYLDNFRSFAERSFLVRWPGQGLNENYARELLELHTLGVDGGYRQDDVREVARAFTGWTFLPMPVPHLGPMDGKFRFQAHRHDESDKVVLGQRIEGGGEEEGERILNLLAAHPSTARFLAEKLVRRFVRDEPPRALVEKVATSYRRTDGDISTMLRNIFYSAEFWSRDTYRAKLKKPFELVTSILRALEAEVEPTPAILGAIRQMGEPTYQCQPPTGYSDLAEDWLSSGTMLHRWNFALATATGRMPGISYPPGDREVKSGEDLVEFSSKQLMGGELSAETKESLIATLDAQLGPGATEGEVPAGRRHYVAGLMLASPDFQRK